MLTSDIFWWQSSSIPIQLANAIHSQASEHVAKRQPHTLQEGSPADGSTGGQVAVEQKQSQSQCQAWIRVYPDTNVPVSPVRADSSLKARSAGVGTNETRITKTEFTDATLFSVAMCTDFAVLILFSNGHTGKTHLFSFFYSATFSILQTLLL